MVAWVRSPKKLVAAFMVVFLAMGIWLVMPEASKKRFESAKTPEEDQTANRDEHEEEKADQDLHGFLTV